MNPRVFNISIGAGVALIGAGVALQFNVPTALITVGILLVCLTMIVARLG